MSKEGISRYVTALFMDPEPTVNNQTIDEQIAGSLRAMRSCVAKGIANFSLIDMIEDAFRKTHTNFLDCILRQSRTPEDVTSGTFTWDRTSVLGNVAHGRQLAADTLYQARHVGIGTMTGSALFASAQEIFGAYGKTFLPNTHSIKRSKGSGNGGIGSLSSKKTFYVWTKYLDGVMKGDQFAGASDVSTIKNTEEWE